ncbi:hypothetical protein EJ05DRAFT_501825 [Pseudovirgaria hyperparasitica]|uniref:Uncharacterized protein n=1 Tax=Pseudovirgaria hyperparasitica TaxID=470096 RepID=A0A6A6W2V7_9PEZI|nr:uncharacterized protein EJ05DRAFT_501825 [Pseudovirgaria hyperparasitica]KAF2756326.1 hypothetical protein EJ05DRAFT_501825 [Pseudovirgaria hyperparasitica]
MFEHFTLFQTPSLFVASAVTFGGLWPFFNAHGAILEFGLPPRVALSKEAQAIMVLSSARGTVVGLSMFMLYFRERFVEFDMVMATLGLYVGAVDAWICWREGMPSKAVFRGVSGALIAAWGLAGMTAPA